MSRFSLRREDECMFNVLLIENRGPINDCFITLRHKGHLYKTVGFS